MLELVCKTTNRLNMKSSVGPSSNGQRTARWPMDGAKVGHKDSMGVLCIEQTAEVAFLQVLCSRAKAEEEAAGPMGSAKQTQEY